METLSVFLALCDVKPSATDGFPHKGRVIQSFEVIFDVVLNKMLNKQWLVIWDATTLMCDVIVKHGALWFGEIYGLNGRHWVRDLPTFLDLLTHRHWRLVAYVTDVVNLSLANGITPCNRVTSTRLKFGYRRWNLQVPVLQMICGELSNWVDGCLITSIITAKAKSSPWL